MEKTTTADRAPLTLLRLFVDLLREPLTIQLGTYKIISGPAWACLLALCLLLYFGSGIVTDLGKPLAVATRHISQPVSPATWSRSFTNLGPS